MAQTAGDEFIFWIRYDEEEQSEIRAWREELECSIVPCDKSLEEFKQFLTVELGMHKVELEEYEFNNKKAIHILNHHADWLKTPEYKLPKDRIPAKEERNIWRVNMEKRHEEAMRIPIEDTGLVFSKYEAEYVQDCGDLARVAVLLEESEYIYEVHGGGRRRATAEEQAMLDDLIERIILYKGVSAEDIAAKSQRYEDYVSHIIAARLRKGEKIK